MVKDTESEIFSVISLELSSARSKYPAFHSGHEGYATILEELDELWEEIRKKPRERSKDRMRKEAVQIAAMAIRFIGDICDRRDIS